MIIVVSEIREEKEHIFQQTILRSTGAAIEKKESLILTSFHTQK